MKESSDILVFGMELVIKGMQNLTPPLLVGCDHFCLLSNKITGKNLERIVSLKESIDLLDFLDGDIIEGMWD